MSGEGPEFCDTNVLVYAHDTTAGAKRERAARLLEGLCASGRCRLSPQVLQEFYVTATRKLPCPLEAVEAARIATDLRGWVQQATDADDVLAGITLARARQLSIWDALIVVAARKSAAEILWTEDLQDGARYLGVTIRNPFTPSGAA